LEYYPLDLYRWTAIRWIAIRWIIQHKAEDLHIWLILLAAIMVLIGLSVMRVNWCVSCRYAG
jgi:hypothetical protein